MSDPTTDSPPVIMLGQAVALVAPTTTTAAAVPAKMTQQKKDLLIKQRERNARNTSSVIPNLASRLSDGTVQPSGPGAAQAVVRPGAQSVGPAPAAASASSAVPKKMSHQEKDLMIKQREQNARNARNTSTVVPNLASHMNDGPVQGPGTGAAQAGVGPTPTASPSVPQKMSRQEEDLMIKQRERNARNTSTLVPNLAKRMSDPMTDDPPVMLGQTVALVALTTTTTTTTAAAVPPKMTPQEKDLLIKQRERQARAGSGVTRTTVVPNLARFVNAQLSVAPPVIPEMIEVPGKMTQQERDVLTKQREQEGRQVTTAGNLSRRLSDPDQDSLLQARCEAAGMLLGEGGEELMRSESLPVAFSPAADSPRRTSDYDVESEQTVRTRYQAATLVMGEAVTQEEEDRQLKERERQALRVLSTTASASVASSQVSTVSSDSKIKAREHASARSVPSTDISVGARARTQQETDLLDKSRGRSQTNGVVHPANADLVADSVDAPAVEGAGQRVGDDALAKSRGRLGRGAPSQHSSETSTATAMALAPAVQMLHGAVAVADGRAEQLGKVILPQQPEMPTLEALSLYPLEEGNLMVGQQFQYLSDVQGGKVAEPLGGGTADAVLEVGKEEHSDDKKPATKRKWYIIAAILLIVAIAGGVGGALAASGGGGSHMPPTQAPSATETPLVESERLIAVRSQLMMGFISSAEALEDTSSPQYRALRWIADKDTVADVNDVEQLKARYILAVFYYSLGGPGWLDADSWLETEVGVGVCDWDRVECDSDMVISIGQKGVNLQGEIPSELQHLPMLGRFENASVTHVYERANIFFTNVCPFPMQKS
jgi:hypothetical protein